MLTMDQLPGMLSSTSLIGQFVYSADDNTYYKITKVGGNSVTMTQVLDNLPSQHTEPIEVVKKEKPQLKIRSKYHF